MFGLAGGFRRWPEGLTLLHEVTSGSVDQSSCTLPSAATVFSREDPQVYVWFAIANARQGRSTHRCLARS